MIQNLQALIRARDAQLGGQTLNSDVNIPQDPVEMLFEFIDLSFKKINDDIAALKVNQEKIIKLLEENGKQSII
jgi:predicted metalloenzyme YecM